MTTPSTTSDRIRREEWLWVAAWSMVLLLLTTFPYVLGAAAQTPDLAFGGFVLAVEDGNTYLAAMRQGAEGQWSFYIPFTPEAHSPGYVFLLYLALGKVARTLGLSLPLVFHLAKLVTTPLLLVAIYRFVAHFTSWLFVRRLTFLLVALGGGLGWLWLVCGLPFAPGVMPTDLWVPDASAFLTMLTFPHLALAQGLILWIITSGLKIIRLPNWRLAAVTGVLGVVVSLVHPYSLPMILALLGLWWIMHSWQNGRPEWASAAQLCLIGILAAPYLVYAFHLFSTNPVFHSWQIQNLIRSPNPVHYVLGYGLVFFLAIAGVISRRPKNSWQDPKFLLLWIVIIPIALYVPSNLQRRLLDGYQAPLTLDAVAGLLFLLQRVRRSWRRWLVLVFCLVCVLTNVLLMAGAMAIAVSRTPPVFHQRDILAAMDWLETDVSPGSVVLGAYDTGNLVPSRAPVRTFVGHGPQSVNADQKRAAAVEFFDESTSDSQRLSLLATYSVDYLFYGPSEQQLGAFDPSGVTFLRPVYEEQGVRVYEVLSEAKE